MPPLSEAQKKAQKKYNESKKGKERFKRANEKRDEVQLDGIDPTTKAKFIEAKMGRKISHNDFILELLNCLK